MDNHLPRLGYRGRYDQETKMRKWKRPLMILAVLLVVWYTAMVCLPRISDGVPALTEMVRENVALLARSGKLYEDVRQDLRTCRWEDTRLPNKYVVRLERSERDSWTLVATPERERTYRHGLLTRCLTLDFDQYEYPTFVVKRGDEFPSTKYPKGEGFAGDRGRDGCRQPPPAQIRTRSTTSYGSSVRSDDHIAKRRYLSSCRAMLLTHCPARCLVRPQRIDNASLR